MCAVVAMESVTICEAEPGVIVADGSKEAVVPAGRVDTLKVTGLENVPLVGETVRGKLALCPAVTEGVELGGVTV